MAISLKQHRIKSHRAEALAPHVPSAQSAISDSISDYLLDRLTAAELAEVRCCLDRHWHKAVVHTERTIIMEGCVWDNRRQTIRELGPTVSAN